MIIFGFFLAVMMGCMVLLSVALTAMVLRYIWRNWDDV